MSLSLKEKTAYGLGDFAGGLIFNASTTYLMFFYTDSLGLSAAAASLLLLLARFWDAILDPTMGLIADRTRSRWGHFRPYLLFVPVPLALTATLAFLDPGLSPGLTLFWAYLTYFLLMTFYTAINIPYGSMPAVMTGNAVERAQLTSFRMSGSFISGIVVNISLLPLVGIYRAYSDSETGGYAFAIGSLCLLVVIAFWVCFAFTRERVQPATHKPHLKQDLNAVMKSRAWWFLIAMGCMMFTFGIFLFYIGLYYLKYVFGSDKIAPVFFTCATLGMLSGSLANLLLLRFFEKRKLAISVLLIGAFFSLCIYLVKPGQSTLLISLGYLSLISVGIGAPIIWALVADCADSIEAQTGRRVVALTTSAVSFSMKAGIGIGGALVGVALSLFSYTPNTVQTAETQMAIKVMISIFPAIGFIGLAILFYYFPVKRPSEETLDSSAVVQYQRT